MVIYQMDPWYKLGEVTKYEAVKSYYSSVEFKLSLSLKTSKLSTIWHELHTSVLVNLTNFISSVNELEKIS